MNMAFLIVIVMSIFRAYANENPELRSIDDKIKRHIEHQVYTPIEKNQVKQVRKEEMTMLSEHKKVSRSISQAQAEYNDSENPEETIYDKKPNEFLIRPIVPHQHQQHEAYQEPQLHNKVHLNYPLAVQLLNQKINNDETQRNLQNYPRAVVATQSKSHITVPQIETENINTANEEERGQQYATFVQPQRSTQQVHHILYQEDPSRHRFREINHRKLYNDALIRATQKVLPHSHPDLKGIRENVPNKDTFLPQYSQYIPQQPKHSNYLSFSHTNHEREVLHQEFKDQLPPQIAYYQPQISYKTFPNHPLAKSSLENEIAKLLAANKSPNGQNTVNSSEKDTKFSDNSPPQAGITDVHEHQRKFASTKPKSQFNANSPQLVSSSFKFTNSEGPTPKYTNQIRELDFNEQKLGLSGYPVQTPTLSALQPSNQLTHYHKIPEERNSEQHIPIKEIFKKNFMSPTISSLETFPNAYKSHPQLPKYFNPSPIDPFKHPSHFSPHSTQRPISLVTRTPIMFANNVKPQNPSPSQSNIYVFQGTGIGHPSHSTPLAPLKTVEDVKKLNLPQPGGKPLTQAAFKALLDAGYPVTAVPVPVPVSFEHYAREQPDYLNHRSANYGYLKRLTTQPNTDNQN